MVIKDMEYNIISVRYLCNTIICNYLISFKIPGFSRIQGFLGNSVLVMHEKVL